MRGSLWVCLALTGALAACAEDIPGEPPPADQLHYPVGLALVPGATPATDVLVVGNTNFDQLYNAGSIVTLPVDALVASLPAAGSTEVAFVPELPAGSQRVRVLQFGGELAVVPGDGAGTARVFMPSRGRNRVTMVELTNGVMSCVSPGATPLLGLDCSAAYVARTFASDPYSIAYTTLASGAGLLAVGHLRTDTNDAGIILNRIALADPKRFDLRIDAERAGADPDDPMIPVFFDDEGVGEVISSATGVTGIAFVPPADGKIARIVTSGRRVSSDAATLPVRVVSIDETNVPVTGPDGNATTRVEPVISVDSAMDLYGNEGVIDMRGVAVSSDATRAFVSVRFLGFGSRVSGGLAVIELGEGGTQRLVSILDVGDELGRPVLVERGARRLLYVPDVRLDVIHVVEASGDVLAIAGTIEGREDRTFEGAPALARTLDSPGGIVFVERDGRRLGFVTNFGNSTLAVFDATSPDPSTHRVIARFGRARNPGNSEEERP
ncbi:hypothetical protein L6R52_19775 [Myxococcota bacterium]|nr:hypothetical protein [Myxococcota bacterium]